MTKNTYNATLWAVNFVQLINEWNQETVETHHQLRICRQLLTESRSFLLTWTSATTTTDNYYKPVKATRNFYAP